MPVPQEYLSVIRPKNTICKMIGNKCAVIQRIGCKRVNGKNIPINGPVIGHIIDGKYVEKKKAKSFITTTHKVCRLAKQYHSRCILTTQITETMSMLGTGYGNVEMDRISFRLIAKPSGSGLAY